MKPAQSMMKEVKEDEDEAKVEEAEGILYHCDARVIKKTKFETLMCIPDS